MYKPHFLMSFGGDLLGGEIWNCGVRTFPQGDVAVAGDPFPQADMDSLGSHLKTWFMENEGAVPTGVTLKWVKYNAIGPDGKYLNKQTTNVADIAGAAGRFDATVPAFLSLATTWRTARTRPPGAFGRVYLPNFASAITGLDPCYATDGARQQALTHAKRLLDIATFKPAINVGGLPVGYGGFVPCVASAVDASLSIITKITVGRVMDVQRPRKNALEELPIGFGYDWQQA